MDHDQKIEKIQLTPSDKDELIILVAFYREYLQFLLLFLVDCAIMIQIADQGGF